MNLQVRIDLLTRLGEYILSDDPGWLDAKEKAWQENAWFIPEFINISAKNISKQFLSGEILGDLAGRYKLNNRPRQDKAIGIVMAGNIPLVGFHDLLCVFLSGRRARIKPSSKDVSLVKHLVNTLVSWNEEVGQRIQIEEMLKGCDAYIATGSNNSSRYFEYYFGKYPHIIRRNRTSAAILEGNETNDELERLADDVHLYFGLGCRNITKLYVPGNYDFMDILAVFKKYHYLMDHYKYKNNYDYNLALHILNNKFYMTNGSVILVESPSLFSPIGQLHYEFYTKKENVINSLQNSEELQAVIGHGRLAFGQAQSPSFMDYADGIDTMEFLNSL